MNGRAGHRGIKTFNWRFCRTCPKPGPAILIASMKILGNPSQQKGAAIHPARAARGQKPVLGAKVFPTLQEAYFSVNARALRPSVITRATL